MITRRQSSLIISNTIFVAVDYDFVTAGTTWSTSLSLTTKDMWCWLSSHIYTHHGTCVRVGKCVRVHMYVCTRVRECMRSCVHVHALPRPRVIQHRLLTRISVIPNVSRASAHRLISQPPLPLGYVAHAHVRTNQVGQPTGNFLNRIHTHMQRLRVNGEQMRGSVGCINGWTGAWVNLKQPRNMSRQIALVINLIISVTLDTSPHLPSSPLHHLRLILH